MRIAFVRSRGAPGAAAVPARAAPAAAELDWRATIFTPAGARGRARCAARLRDRVEVVDRGRGRRGRGARGAPTWWSPRRSARRRRPGCSCARSAPARSRSPRASRAYEEVLRDGALGLLFEPGDVDTLAAQLAPPDRRREPARAASPARSPPAAPELAWRAVAERFEAIYADGRRPPPSAALGRAAAGAAGRAAADRRRPAHAHRPLARLRDAGRRAAGDGPRRRPRRDRRDRPQRGLGRARGARPRRTSTASR